jgi:hypothetical protein
MEFLYGGKMITPKDYMEAKANIDAKYAEEEEWLKGFKAAYDRREDDFRNKESAITEAKYAALTELKKTKEAKLLEFENARTYSKTVSEEANLIFNLFDISRRKDRNLVFGLYTYGYPKDVNGKEVLGYKDATGDWISYEKIKHYIEPFGILRDDEYAKICAFIVENDKPINKFSLIIAGKTIFPDDLTKLDKAYGWKVHDDNARVRLTIRDAPTKKELLDYYHKNIVKIRANVLDRIVVLVAQYEEALSLWNDKEWQKLYWENKANYYRSGYHNGTETPKYKEVMEQLKLLQ